MITAICHQQRRNQKMTVELERSYVFPSESIPHILGFLKARTIGLTLNIQDDYLTSDLRIRSATRDDTGFVGIIQLTRKVGNKSSGQRIEENRNIDTETATILIPDSKLRVIKKRYNIHTPGSDFIVTLDTIEEPMKMAILEIESTNGESPPTAKEVFGVELRECPLSTWDLFRQKIGICGAPSSGKTETAKAMSHLLNTHLHANSFHVLEYATSFIQKYDRHPTAMDQFMLWYSQRAREENAASKANIVISDCPTFLSYIYMMFHNRGKMDAQFRIHLAKLYKRVLEDIDGYSHLIYLRPQHLVENDIRFQSVDEIRDIAERIYAFLRWHGIPHIVAEQGDTRRILGNLFYMNETGNERWDH